MELRCTWTGKIPDNICEGSGRHGKKCPDPPPPPPPPPTRGCPPICPPGGGPGDPTPTRPKPKPVDPADKAREQLEQNVKQNKQPNAPAAVDPVISRGNPTGGGTSQNQIQDTRGQADQIYKDAVEKTGNPAQNAQQHNSPFGNERADLKQSWNNLVDVLKNNKGAIGHGLLDVVGLIPGLGEVADLANAAWYAAEGDYVNAALSAASAIPIAGYAATAAKAGRYINRGVKLGKGTTRAGEDAARLGRKIPCECFPRGTPVDTASGPKPIEKVKVGDRVYARDQVTGKTQLRKVTSLFRKKAEKLMTVTLAGGSKVAVTSKHPFYTPDRGWVESGDLKPGDTLLQRDGTTTKIQAVTTRAVTTTVYNLSVENDHNYYVGASSLLVHNCPPVGSMDELLDGLSDETFFHYTDEAGAAGIIGAGKLAARNGKAFLTQGMYTHQQAWTHLFAGNPAYLEKGSHLIAFTIPAGALIRKGEQPNEFIHQGSLTLERILYAGKNPFGTGEW